MIVPRIDYIHSPDADPLESWRPQFADQFEILLELSIGDEKNDGDNIFSCVVATPKGVLQHMRHREFVIYDKAIILVQFYDWNAIRTHLEHLVASCSARTWRDVLGLLRRYFQYEYDDCHHPNDVN